MRGTLVACLALLEDGTLYTRKRLPRAGEMWRLQAAGLETGAHAVRGC